jgi:hypothetical protein
MKMVSLSRPQVATLLPRFLRLVLTRKAYLARSRENLRFARQYSRWYVVESIAATTKPLTAPRLELSEIAWDEVLHGKQFWSWPSRSAATTDSLMDSLLGSSDGRCRRKSSSALLGSTLGRGQCWTWTIARLIGEETLSHANDDAKLCWIWLLALSDKATQLMQT